MLTFVTVLFHPVGPMRFSNNTAPYNPEWANKLYRGVKRNLTQDFRFICLTDFDHEGFEDAIDVRPFIYPDHVGRWMCINEIFRYDLNIDRGVFMGLDTIIVNNVDALSLYEGDFCMVRHPKKPHVRMNAVTLFDGPRNWWIWEHYLDDPEKADSEARNEKWATHQGSEMLWWDRIKPDADLLHEQVPINVCSFKIQKKEIGEADILFFHGSTKPNTCAKHPLVLENWV